MQAAADAGGPEDVAAGAAPPPPAPRSRPRSGHAPFQPGSPPMNDNFTGGAPGQETPNTPPHVAVAASHDAETRLAMLVGSTNGCRPPSHRHAFRTVLNPPFLC
jgi:hypothetical protein